MQRFNLPRCVTTSLLALVIQSTRAGEEAEGVWHGSWSDGEGGTVFVQQHNQMLDVTGKDAISVYTMRCLLAKSEHAAKCQGQGRQLASGESFLYQTQWRMHQGSIVEKWTAEFTNNTLSGELVFMKDRPAEIIR